MNRIVYLAVSIVSMVMFAACSSGDELLTRTTTPLNPEVSTADFPATEVFVQGAELEFNGSATTRAYSYGGVKWPQAHVDEGWDVARYSVRIDNTIAEGLGSFNVSTYWGGFGQHPNLGSVYEGFGYSHYNDRNYDYRYVEKETGEYIGLFRYAYNPMGIDQFKILREIPSVTGILESYLKTEKNETNKKGLKAAVDGLNDGSLKVIWYIAKEVALQYGWHVNGVVTKATTASLLEVTKIGNEINKDVTNYKFETTHPFSVVPDEVEVDIHLQEHKDWNEIKVSAHIRADASSVTINLPLDKDNIIEQNSFDVRVYDYYFKDYGAVKHEIKHNDNGVTIEISNISATMIDELKDTFGDGLNVEVHSFCKAQDGVWEQLKKSTVTTGNPCTLRGQITSAYSDDKVVIGE